MDALTHAGKHPRKGARRKEERAYREWPTLNSSKCHDLTALLWAAAARQGTAIPEHSLCPSRVQHQSTQQASLLPTSTFLTAAANKKLWNYYKKKKPKCHNQDKMTKFFQERTLHMERICIYFSFHVYASHSPSVFSSMWSWQCLLTLPPLLNFSREKRARFCLFIKSCSYLFAAWFPYWAQGLKCKPGTGMVLVWSPKCMPGDRARGRAALPGHSWNRTCCRLVLDTYQALLEGNWLWDTGAQRPPAWHAGCGQYN